MKKTLTPMRVQLGRIVQGWAGLLLLYQLIAMVVSHVYGARTGNPELLPRLFEDPIRSRLCELLGFSELCAEIQACVTVGAYTLVILSLVCDTEWVKETVRVKECWEETTWWNPWTWVKSIVCTVYEVTRWILKQICRWKWILVPVLIVVCIWAAISAA